MNSSSNTVRILVQYFEEILLKKVDSIMFGKKKKSIEYDISIMTPVIHASICTGEQVAGFKNKETGKFEEVMLIRDGKDMDKFMEMYDLTVANIKKEY